MTTPALEAIDLHKSYRKGLLGRARQVALRGVSFRVNRGEIFGLLGQNGAGKTTFIKIALGIARRTAGQATMLGFPAGDRRARKMVGYLPENLRVPRHLTGYTALEYYGGLSGVSRGEVYRRAPELLEMVGIATRAKDNVATYSKGMLQRLGLAQAMLHDPELYILDEPTDGLDPMARAQMRGYLTDLKKRGKTIFLNSHILQEVELVCDRVAILHQGVLQKVGDVQDLRREHKPTSAATAATLEVALEFAGEEQSLRSALGTLAPLLVRTNDGNWTLTTTLASQAEIDSLIDAVRKARVSIIHLARRRASLEDAFMQIVTNAEVVEPQQGKK
jgi:ABC-2 type transport system ATP-binding protein